MVSFGEVFGVTYRRPGLQPEPVMQLLHHVQQLPRVDQTALPGRTLHAPDELVPRERVLADQPHRDPSNGYAVNRHVSGDPLEFFGYVVEAAED